MNKKYVMSGRTALNNTEDIRIFIQIFCQIFLSTLSSFACPFPLAFSLLFFSKALPLLPPILLISSLPTAVTLSGEAKRVQGGGYWVTSFRGQHAEFDTSGENCEKWGIYE